MLMMNRGMSMSGGKLHNMRITKYCHPEEGAFPKALRTSIMLNIRALLPEVVVSQGKE